MVQPALLGGYVVQKHMLVSSKIIAKWVYFGVLLVKFEQSDQEKGDTRVIENPGSELGVVQS